MMRYALAERLHMTVEALGDLTVEEFAGWQAYFQLRGEAAPQ